MADLGEPDSVVRAEDPNFQKQIWEVRKAGSNIMMSMRGDAKPISIVEDCAVELKDLAEYTRRLTEVLKNTGPVVVGTHTPPLAHCTFARS